jgi:hypothetical protein
MAQQAVRKQVETEGPRRRAPRVPVLKTGTPALNYEGFRLTINDPDEFMRFMKGYPNPQGVTIFLYRLVPRIDLSLIGLEEANIQKGSIDDLHLFTLDAVAEKFGRGKYNIRVTDSNRPDGQRQVIQTCPYKLFDAEKPPVYNPQSLVLGHADNIDEVNRLISAGVLVRDASGSPRLRTVTDPPASVAPVYAAPVSPGDRSATDLLYQIAVEAFKTSRQSPTEAVKDVIGMAQFLQREPAAPSIDQIAEAVAAKLGGGPRGPAADPFAQWEKVQGFIDRAAGMVAERAGVASPAAAAAVAGEAGSSWAPHVASIISEVRAFWPEVLHGIRLLRSEQRGSQAAVHQNGALQMLPMNQRIETIFKAGFESMQRGIAGVDFARWLCISGEFPGGLEAFNLLRPGGAAGLITMAGTDARGAQIVNDATVRPQLDAFLASFFSFDPSATAAA